MTIEEKAREIADKNYDEYDGGDFISFPECEKSALEMAEWKDAQFEEIKRSFWRRIAEIATKDYKGWEMYYIADITKIINELSGIRRSNITNACTKEGRETASGFIWEYAGSDVAEKIRKVLNGADVIEMPSNEEIAKESDSSAHKMSIDDGETPNSGLYWRGWWDAVKWLKSKII